MNRLLRYSFFGLVAVIFQTYLMPALGIFGQKPDLIVIFAPLKITGLSWPPVEIKIPFRTRFGLSGKMGCLRTYFLDQ